MTRTTKYVALDVHQASTVASVREEGGRVIARGHPRGLRRRDAGAVDADQLSALLWRGGLRAVYHGSALRAEVKELTRTYQNLVEDGTRMMLRLKALFRALRPKAKAAMMAEARRVDLARQLLPGTFEHALNHLLEHAVDLYAFDARCRNDATGAPAYPPALLLKVVLFAYLRGPVRTT